MALSSNPQDDVVAVRVNSRIYDKWNSATITRSLKSLASSFSLSLPWFLPPAGESLLAQPGDACAVYIGDELAVNGYFDTFEKAAEKDGIVFRLPGRSLAGDLVDCSAMLNGGQFRGLTLDAIAAKVCAPFGVSVSVADGVDVGKPFGQIEIQQKDTPNDVIKRHAAQRGLLCWSAPDGGLVIGRGAREKAQVPLIYKIGPNGEPMPGNTALSSTGSCSIEKRFSEIIVRGQGAWTAGGAGKSAAMAQGRATDGAVSRYRPKIINASGQADAADMAQQAEWEVARRVASSTEISMTVEGWRQVDGGPLWVEGLEVSVEDNTLNIAADMIVSSVKFVINKNDQYTVLTLEPPEAAKPQTEQAAGAGGAVWQSVSKQTNG